MGLKNFVTTRAFGNFSNLNLFRLLSSRSSVYRVHFYNLIFKLTWNKWIIDIFCHWLSYQFRKAFPLSIQIYITNHRNKMLFLITFLVSSSSFICKEKKHFVIIHSSSVWSFQKHQKLILICWAWSSLNTWQIAKFVKTIEHLTITFID